MALRRAGSKGCLPYLFYIPVMVVRGGKEENKKKTILSSGDERNGTVYGNLHARGDQLAVGLAVRVPATSKGLPAELALVLLDSGLQLGTEVSDETLDGPGEGLAQGADGVALDLLGEFLEHVDLALAGLALLHALHHLGGPLASLAAGGALAATLVLVELGQTGDGADDVGGLVHDDDGGSTQTGLGVLEGVEVHDLVVADGLGDDWGGGTTGDDGEEVVPAAAHTTAVTVDQLTQRDGHLLLDCAGVVDVARNTEQLCTGVALGAERREPAGSTTHDGRADGDGLNVGDGGGAAEQTDGGGEWGLQARLAGLAFDRLDERCLLTTDIGTHPAVDVNIEVVARTAGVLANETSLVGLVDSPLEDGCFVVEFATDVDVGGVGVHGATDNETTLNQLVGILAHDLTVLACARFTLIGVDNQVSGSWILIPILEVHERLMQIRKLIVFPEARRIGTVEGLTYFKPEGKPAPPRPRRPEALISEISCRS